MLAKETDGCCFPRILISSTSIRSWGAFRRPLRHFTGMSLRATLPLAETPMRLKRLDAEHQERFINRGFLACDAAPPKTCGFKRSSTNRIPVSDFRCLGRWTTLKKQGWKNEIRIDLYNFNYDGD